MPVMKEYQCVRKCFFQGVRYRPADGNFEGDTLITDLPASKIPSHFNGGKLLSVLDGGRSKKVASKERKPVLEKEFPEEIVEEEDPKDVA